MPVLAWSAPKRRSSAGASRRMKASRTSPEHSARPTTFQSPRFSGGRWRMYSGNRSIFTRVWVPSALAAAVHRPIVSSLRHVGQHGGIHVVGKYSVEEGLKERCLVARRAFARAHHEPAHPPGRKLAAARRHFNGLV